MLRILGTEVPHSYMLSPQHYGTQYPTEWGPSTPYPKTLISPGCKAQKPPFESPSGQYLPLDPYSGSPYTACKAC